MLRITHVSRATGVEELQAEGWIDGEYVALLEQAGDDAWRPGCRWVLDLEGVESIDASGIALLQRWARERVVLRGASPYLRLVLAQHRLSCEESGDGG